MLIYGSITPQLVQTEARSSLIRRAATLKSVASTVRRACVCMCVFLTLGLIYILSPVPPPPPPFPLPHQMQPTVSL